MTNKYAKDVNILGQGSGSKTKKGTKPNHSGEKLVNITNGMQIVRVRHSTAARMIARDDSWKYCPKRFKIE